MGLSICFFIFMQILLWLLLFHLTHAQSSTSSMQSFCHNDERSALLQFKESLLIDKFASQNPSPYPKVESWKADEGNADCCSWDGITCDEDTGYVIGLDLSNSWLYGSINSRSTLFHLVHLEWLNLAGNHFNYSKIPSGIVNLSELSYLDLSSSFFFGQIPSEIQELSKLETLSASGNYWQGEFPVKIFKLPNLHFLSVHYNQNLTGYLPEFEKNSPLEVLRLEETGFSGRIPDSVGNLKSLSYLNIRYCNFLGTIPSSLGNLTQLRYLILSHNEFCGELPTSMGNLGSLELLDLGPNSFLSQNWSSFSWIANLTKITKLKLSKIPLGGEIPSWLLNLTHLSHLTLSDNKLTGPIPCWLMNLNQLTRLYLPFNQLTGHIPFEIGNLTQLSRLHLGSNQLEGPIPSSIFELKNLEQIDLHSNNFSGAFDLDTFLLKLRNLEVFVFSSNNLSLLAETSVHTNFQKFKVIGLSSCNLNTFPKFLQKQEQLQSLDLSSNNIVGQIPRWLLNVGISTLQYLNLSYNLLTGFDRHVVALPWTHLVTLDLRSNKLQGPLPNPPVSTFAYLVSDNMMTGSIPPWICNLNQLYALDLSYNNLSGLLPQCLGNFSNQLSILQLQGNKFCGSIPQTFMNGTNLRMIDLSQNLLEGRIPRSMANCTMLEFLNLGSNQITDMFPFWLGALTKLTVLILKANRFYGIIKEPETDLEFPELRIIDLSHNGFTGNLPSKYFQCWNAMKIFNASELKYMENKLLPRNYPMYTYHGSYGYSLTMCNKGIEIEYGKLSNLITGIILSNNEFVGEIPSSIGNLKGLRNLNISNNYLQAHLPSSLGNLTVLESLDLSNNLLFGEIPQELAELSSLQVFDVSHNRLTGSIPQGRQFNTSENSSFNGNLGLCGKPLTKKCENPKPTQKEDEVIEDSDSLFAFDWEIVLTGFAGGLITGVVLGHTFSTAIFEWFGKIIKSHSK